ncbi:MAG: hypothetical protein JJ992_04595, partial [Planctomycetes bacterium]|nr:hypothetical protein [Planctomycetota bacterium]
MGLRWLRLPWFLLAAYGLLWVASLALFVRRSASPEVLGWWSRRMFGLVMLDLAAMMVLTVALVLAFRPQSRWSRFLRALLE